MPMKLVERGCGKTFTLWNWFLCLGILLTSNYMGIWTNINLNLLIRVFSITNQNLKKGFWHFHLFQISGVYKLNWCHQPKEQVVTFVTSLVICLVLIVMCHIICDNIHKHDQRIFSGTHQISVALLTDKNFQYFWQSKMFLPFIFLGPPYLISIIFRQMSILHYIWHKPISQPSAEYWARGKGKSLPKVTSVLGYFSKKAFPHLIWQFSEKQIFTTSQGKQDLGNL